MEWKAKKEEWKSSNNRQQYLVVVCHWTDGDCEYNYWNIYVYIYPGNPLFESLTHANAMHDDAVMSLSIPGLSFFKKHYNDNCEITSVQIGGDYHHLGQDRFRGFTTPKEAREVFMDAEELINRMDAIIKAKGESQ